MYAMPIITVERMIALFASERYEAWTFPKLMTLVNLLPELGGLLTMPMYTITYGLLLYWYTVRSINTVPKCCQRKRVRPHASESDVARERVVKETDLYFQVYSANNPLCIESKEIYTNVWLVALFCSTLLLDIVAFVCCVVGAKSVYNTQLLHVNLRISLCNICLGLLVRGSFTAFRCTRYLVHAVALTNPCDFLEMRSFCNVYSGLHHWGYLVVIYTIPIISVERMIALLASARYETWTFPKLMTFVNLFPWMYGGYNLYTIIEKLRDTSLPVVYCSSFTGVAFKITILDLIDASFLLPLTCLCVDIVMQLFCKYLNNKLFRSEFHEHSLTHRFQLNEILRTSKIAIPASSLFCFLNTASFFVVVTPASMGFFKKTLEFAWYKELGALTNMPVYTIFYGLLLYWYNVRSIKSGHQCCQRKQVTPILSATDQTQERVFFILRNFWLPIYALPQIVLFDIDHNPLCIESQEIYTNVWLIALFCSTLLLDIIAFVCCAVGAKSVYNTQLLHVNLRISLFSISLGLLVRAVFTAFRCCRYLYHAVAFTNPCDFLDTTFFCGIYSGLHSWGYIVIMYAIPIITVERMIALLASARYEAWTFPKLVTFVNLLPWLYGGYNLYDRFDISKGTSYPVIYCSSFSGAVQKLTILDLINHAFLIPFICLCIDIFMQLFCKYLINKLFRGEFHKHSLTHRFQLNEILRTSKIAIPASSLFCFLNTTNDLILVMPASTGLVKRTLEFAMYKEIGALTTMPVYTIIYGILLYWYSDRSINTVSQCCQRRQVKPYDSATDVTRERVLKETDMYFQIYSARW
uniref:Very-long-chain (3R)-3-hydroxyacyl-CoA dehydratase n=1 Tax=Panagrellus redivivus TaxID=6233 RepID=A0A7E4UWL6_PANRE